MGSPADEAQRGPDHRRAGRHRRRRFESAHHATHATPIAGPMPHARADATHQEEDLWTWFWTSCAGLRLEPVSRASRSPGSFRCLAPVGRECCAPQTRTEVRERSRRKLTPDPVGHERKGGCRPRRVRAGASALWPGGRLSRLMADYASAPANFTIMISSMYSDSAPRLYALR